MMMMGSEEGKKRNILTMEDLPPALILEILNRLADAADLARCRVASKSLNSLSREFRCIKLRCSAEVYSKYRNPLTRFSVTPFKTIFKNLVSELRIVEFVSIGVDDVPHVFWEDWVEGRMIRYEDFYLTSEDFVKEWLPTVCNELTTLWIADFGRQCYHRRSLVLSLISSYCQNLVELKITKAKLSANNMSLMPKLSKLTLKNIELNDSNLSKLNASFPALQVLNLIEVRGLREPKIHLLQLKTCAWIAFNAAYYVTIIAPKLVKLKLKCEWPEQLVIDTPSLTDLYLYLEGSRNFKVQGLVNLETLHLESSKLHQLLPTLPFGKTIQCLKLGSTKSTEPLGLSRHGFELLFRVFPNVNSLTLPHWVWSELESYPYPENIEQVRDRLKGLKEITAYIKIMNIEVTQSLIFSILDYCSNLSNMNIFIHYRDAYNTSNTLISSRCMTCCPRLEWRWGMWNDVAEDAWILDGI